ncbi:Xaa-Pro peptidase family protein [Bacillus sp. FSL W7-1360]
MGAIVEIQRDLAAHNIDGLLIETGINLRYVSGFTGTSGALLLTKTAAFFVTDFRYTEQAKAEVSGCEFVWQKGALASEVANLVKKLAIKRLGFEKARLTYETYETYQQLLPEVTLVPVADVVETHRLVKTDAELAIMQKAADIADAAFTHIQSFIRPGVTELSVANELEFFMRKQGATSSSFDMIVASGVRGALPHGVASEKEIQAGELVTLDYGAYYQGYCSDMTRTLAVGPVSDQLRNIYETVRVAQQLGMDGTKAGITGQEADRLTRDYIVEKGYGAYFGHSTGHGLGMEVHEAPALSSKSTDVVLRPGMVVTIEPGIYVPNVGGVRIEDDIVITDEGNRSLTKSPKTLIELDV